MTGWVWLPMEIPVGLDRDDARRRAMEELAKAKYGGSPGWFDEAVDRIFRLLSRLSQLYRRMVAAQQGGGEGINWGFVVAVTVLLLACALVIWKVGRPKWRHRPSDASLELDASTRPADYRAQAEAAASRGDWRAAVRDRFRAIVRELEDRTILQVRPARTAWEAAYSAVRLMPGSQAALFDGADLFNRVVYGEQPADEASYARMVLVDDAVTWAAERVDLRADTATVSTP